MDIVDKEFNGFIGPMLRVRHNGCWRYFLLQEVDENGRQVSLVPAPFTDDEKTRGADG